ASLRRPHGRRSLPCGQLRAAIRLNLSVRPTETVMRILLFLTLMLTIIGASAQQDQPPRALTKDQHALMQRCVVAASTVATAARNFPRSEEDRLNFIKDIFDRFSGATGDRAALSPTKQESVMAFVSMEADLKNGSNMSDVLEGDLLVARA